ncbi:fimbrial protein [Cronobacter sakazakii]|nr:fimbrial protein [Cronobacter sakazakii]ELY4594203.1 fimbrial protein [Cronobacter sakazakii]
MKKAFLPGIALLIACVSSPVPAEDNTIQITVSVTISIEPCEINHNQDIDVDFGDNVITTEVAQGIYEKAIDYTLDCGNAIPGKMLKMRLVGNGASFDSDVLKTSVDALGVKFKNNGVDYPLNSDVNFISQENKPALTAMLVKKNGTRLPTGAFSAGATMMVDYQ